MALSAKEKDLILQALQFYLHQASAQLPQSSLQQLVRVVQGIADKLDNLEAGAGVPGQAPAGISEEWFENVCQTCTKLNHSGCTDPVTAKFPGKCDPILKYERAKPNLA